MRYVVFVILIAASLACRDIVPFSNDASIQGYQLNGTVTTPNGVAVDSVEVRLFYGYDFLSSTPSDTQQVKVTASQSLVTVNVYTPGLVFVRQLFLGYRSTGPVPRFVWNGRDASNNPVPSGKYLIRYSVDSTVVKYSPVIIEGHLSATTDAAGHFVLASSRFPIGDVFDLYDDANAYAGTYRVTSSVGLILQKLTLHVTYSSVDLRQDKVTSRIFVLQ